ncbi:MAG TPA: hypothetical protein VFE15_05420 [Marmoricola sp.]|jgi:hypothetical protein|nr:hypothetical protein [Marmoricola sp.]
MSGIEEPGTPLEVPEEYAAVYRDAYLRALAEESAAGDGSTAPGAPVDAAPIAAEPEAAGSGGPYGGSRWRIPVAVAAAVLVLIGAAYGIGKLVGGGSSNGAPASAHSPSGADTLRTQPSEPLGSGRPHPSRRPGHSASSTTTSSGSDAYDGSVTAVTGLTMTASCTAPPGVDSAGHPVDYEARNAVDGDSTTAWRCDGSGVGTTLTITLPSRTEVAEVGLIPGYAKTDPTSGDDRYAENNRITEVRWTLSDGVIVEQKLDGSPTDRDVQLLRVPATATSTISLQIVAVRHGSRDTTAISEVAVSAAS